MFLTISHKHSIFLILICLNFLYSSRSHALMCSSLVNEITFAEKPITDSQLDLIAEARRQTRNLTPREAKKLNDDFYNKLVDFRPPPSNTRARSITSNIAQSVLNAIIKSPVAGSIGVYDQPDVSIGYCFGRATFAHLLLLKMGVQKESIFKIWAVGPMKAPYQNIDWQFHVATVVFTRDRGWMVIDANAHVPQTVDHWMMKFTNQSTDKKIRFYLSEAHKFGVDLGRYSRPQMGLTLARENDWYRGYFADMMKELRTSTLEMLGVKRVPPEGPNDRDSFVVQKKTGIGGVIRDFLGF